MTRRARWRRSISWTTRPASIVLPRPTSSAMSRLTLGMARARATGSSWYSSIVMPDRNGAWSVRVSALATVPQRTASRKAPSCWGSSQFAGVTAGSWVAGTISRPGSISQATVSSSPRSSSLTLVRLTRVRPGSLVAASSSWGWWLVFTWLTTHCCPRTRTSCPASGTSGFPEGAPRAPEASAETAVMDHPPESSLLRTAPARDARLALHNLPCRYGHTATRSVLKRNIFLLCVPGASHPSR